VRIASIAALVQERDCYHFALQVIRQHPEWGNEAAKLASVALSKGQSYKETNQQPRPDEGRKDETTL
jgi:hypothetical protein